MKPIIGILIRYDENEKGTPLEFVFDSTRRAVIKMGGEPLLLCPPQDIDYFKTKREDYPDLTMEEIKSALYWLNLCDGLFIPGGNKISPYDFFMVENALERKLPILGVCLGMQILASYKQEHIMLGDVLNKDLHSCSLEEKYAHEVTIDKDSKLYSIFQKERLHVNSFHTKMVEDSKFLTPVAYASDGVIEAVEMKNYPFCIGVQWHPEHMISYDSDMQKLFASFFLEAEKKKNQKVKVKI